MVSIYFLKNVIKKITPRCTLRWYHFTLAVIASATYRFPSKKLIVIGVTGTEGKTTTVVLIGRLLQQFGKTGWISTATLCDGNAETLNDLKMTMPGRFYIQRFLRGLVNRGAKYVVIETSSEGIAQFRHIGIAYDILVFTNLRPEHIESHGSFENYKKAKGKVFAYLQKTARKQGVKKTIIVNGDDAHAPYFAHFWAEQKIEYQMQKSKIKNQNDNVKFENEKNIKCDYIVQAEDIITKKDGVDFSIKNTMFHLPLLGTFNVYNALAALSVLRALGFDLAAARETLKNFKTMPGRMEYFEKNGITVVVDYAHTPTAFEEVYKTVRSIKNSNGRVIGVFGSCGGGRDKWKRKELGKLASQYCDYFILTNEDPYDEDEKTIIENIKEGISNGKQYDVIMDRKKAIETAINFAQPNDFVVITGKGSEQWMMMANNKKIAWDDREVVKGIMKNVNIKNQNDSSFVVAHSREL